MLLLTEYMDLRILVEEVIENFEQYTNLDSKKISEKTPSDKLTKPIEYYRNNPCGELNAGKPHRQQGRGGWETGRWTMMVNGILVDGVSSTGFYFGPVKQISTDDESGIFQTRAELLELLNEGFVAGGNAWKTWPLPKEPGNFVPDGHGTFLRSDGTVVIGNFDSGVIEGPYKMFEPSGTSTPTVGAVAHFTTVTPHPDGTNIYKKSFYGQKKPDEGLTCRVRHRKHGARLGFEITHLPTKAVVVAFPSGVSLIFPSAAADHFFWKAADRDAGWYRIAFDESAAGISLASMLHHVANTTSDEDANAFMATLMAGSAFKAKKGTAKTRMGRVPSDEAAVLDTEYSTHTNEAAFSAADFAVVHFKQPTKSITTIDAPNRYRGKYYERDRASRRTRRNASSMPPTGRGGLGTRSTRSTTATTPCITTDRLPTLLTRMQRITKSLLPEGHTK